MDLTKFKRSRIVHMCFAICFFTSGLIVNILQCLCFLTIKPFNKRLYRKIGYYLCYVINGQLVFMATWWAPCKVNLYADPEVVRKAHSVHALLLMNHTYEIDWLIGWVFTDKTGLLGNCKAYSKRVIQYIPIVGWSWKFAEYIFLERSIEKDKEIIGRQINEVFDYPDPVWLLLNAEGTRFTPAKHEESVKFAKARNMPVLKHHLIPRTKGFTVSLPYVREKCNYIVDVQLAFKQGEKIAPTITNLLFGNEMEAHMYVNFIDLNTVPTNEADAAQWLHETFQRKDRMQDSFHRHGSFFTDSGVKEQPRTIIQRRIHPLLNTMFWGIVTLTPMLYYLGKLLLSGQLFYFSLGAGILVIFYMLMERSIDMSKIGLASNYGAKNSSNKSQ